MITLQILKLISHFRVEFYSFPSLLAPCSFQLIQCGRESVHLRPPICAAYICHVNQLVKNRPVTLALTGWLSARTLFDRHFTDVEVSSCLPLYPSYNCRFTVTSFWSTNCYFLSRDPEVKYYMSDSALGSV
ncbi:unnamed protein product [Protopolystoma xenopodis]|uniref:Uncharacterized protein n=1 Tax=Protopolystoma xenopodis TaxID=117903 RepID=A0A448XCS4_9PLAT|nr:unnamed protein product [Protopolystoma xenopodis]